MNPVTGKPVCAITGTGGYVGGAMKDFFAARGWEILELTRRPRPGTRAAAFQLGEQVAPETFTGVDALVHCAYDFKPLHPKEIHAVNVDGTRKLLQAARTAGVGKLVCLSSISAFAGCRSRYGHAKLEIEKITLDHGALVIRPGLVHGQRPGGMFGKLVEQVRRSSVLPLIGDGSQIQFLVHHDDLATFLESYASGKSAIAPGVLTAAHERPWPFRELLQEIAHGIGKPIRFIPLPWRLVWAGLKSAEACGLRLNFRSDNLISLMHQNPRPDFAPNAAAGLVCRPFQIKTPRDLVLN